MVNQEYYKLGQKIRNFRIRSGKSQMELELEIGASAGSLSRIENGEVNPTKETLLKIIDTLNLGSIEASDLFGFDTKNISKLLKIPLDLITSNNIEQILRKAVNDIIYELNLLSGFITLKKDRKLFAQASTERWFDKVVFEIIGDPFETLNVDLDKDIDNLCVKAFNNKTYYLSNNLEDITVPAVTPKISKILSKIVNFKSGIVLPIISNGRSLGTFFVGKNYNDDFKSEIPILLAFAEYIGDAIKRVE